MLKNEITDSPLKTVRNFALGAIGGEAVSRVAQSNKNSIFSAENAAQYYVFIEGVAGVLAKWFRPAAKRSMGYLTQKRDKDGNFCK